MKKVRVTDLAGIVITRWVFIIIQYNTTLGDEEMPTPEISMKKLSPSEPLIKTSINISIELHRMFPISKARKIIQQKYSLSTRQISDRTLNIDITVPIKLLNEIREKMLAFLDEIKEYVVSVCMSYKYILKNICPCNMIDTVVRKENLPQREICLIKLDNYLFYVICNKKKNYSSVRVLERIISTNIDLLQVPHSVFIICGGIDVIKQTINKVVEVGVEIRNQIAKPNHDNV